MGLKERIAAKYDTGRDFVAELTAALDEGDVLLGTTLGRAAAAKKSSYGLSVEKRVTSLITSGVANSVNKANHVGGDKGSIAAGLSLKASETSGMLVLSVFGFSVWTGMYGTATPNCELRIAREDIVAIVRSQMRTRRGMDQARLQFRDGSFFDFFASTYEGSEKFWDAAALVRPPA